MTVVDAHLHVWDLAQGDYAWLGPQHGELHRSFLPDEAGRELAAAGVASAVLVQAEDSVRETRYLLRVAERAPVGPRRRRLGPARRPRPRRRSSSTSCSTRPCAASGTWCTTTRAPTSSTSPRCAAAWRSSPSAASCSTCPTPGPGTSRASPAWPRPCPSSPWSSTTSPSPRAAATTSPAGRSCLRRVAEHPGVVAKLSGLHVPGQPFTSDALRPVLDVALEAFGADRLMFGSDWPMTTSVGGYPAALAVVEGLVAELSAHEQRAVWSDTATRVYGKRLRQERA